MDLQILQALVAAEPLVDRMLLVGLEAEDPVAIDGG